MNDDGRRGTLTSLSIALVLLVLLALAVLEFGGALLPTLGIVTVGAALFLPLSRTLIVAAVAVGLAVLLVLTQPIDHPGTRVGNVALACALALLASWTIGQRMKSIQRLVHTQASVFASVPDSLAVLSADGTIEDCNEGLATIVPRAASGVRLHPLLDHHLADGTPCPGGCLLDHPASGAVTLLDAESIAGPDRRIAIDYTAAQVDEGRTVVSLRDVTAILQAEQDRRLLVQAAARHGEQKELLRALGAPAYSPLPDVAGVRLDVYSAPGEPGAPAAGDLVDVSRLPDGKVLIMIADALGEAVMSVRDAARVLNIARAYLQVGIRLEDIVARTAQTLSGETQQPDVSLMVAVLDPATGRLDLVGGGHPPALLIRENGATEWLEGASPGIGAPQPSASAIPITRQIMPADSLVFYTDGVVDGAADVIEGLSTLRSSAAALRKRSTAGWARTVADAVKVPDQNSGNATVLLVRLDPSSGSLQTSATR